MYIETSWKRVPEIRKIAVLRANALGDFICVLPAVEALRRAYPDSQIVLLAKQWHADFLKDRTGPIDRVIVVPAYGGVSEPPGVSAEESELDAFFAAMRAEQFDLALQTHGGGRHSNPFVHRLGARMTVGLKTPDAIPLDRWVPYIFLQPEILRYLEVASLVGAADTALEPHVTVMETDLREARHIVEENWSSGALVALHPGAGDPKRRWPVEKFAAVGDALAVAGAHVLVTGTPGERDLVEGVIQHMQAPAQNLCGRLSLGGLAGVLSRCAVVVSNDSGPLHLAGAVGAATVGIYWCWNIMNYGPITRARHRPFVSWRFTCPICHMDQAQKVCSHSASLVADVLTEEVTMAALELFHTCSLET